MTEIVGTNSDDVLDGTDGPDRIDGLAGNDRLSGLSGLDTLLGDGGNDFLDGGGGDDSIDGGAGDDTLIGGLGNDRLAGGTGADSIIGSISDRDGISELNEVFGGEGNDTIFAAGNIFGDGGDDLIRFGYEGSAAAGITVSGGSGDDTLTPRLGLTAATVVTALDGGEGHDEITGTDSADSVVGGLGNDTIRTEKGNDTVEAGAGNDTVVSTHGNNLIFGETGNDFLTIEIGPDGNRLDVGPGTLDGGAGNDTLQGGPSDDRLLGGTGDDKFEFSRGNNTLVGGDGIDTAVYGPRSILLIAQDGTSLVVMDNRFADPLVRDVLTGIEVLQLSDDPSFALTAAVAGTIQEAGDGGGILAGTAFDDELSGDVGNDTLVGLSGNDRLSGFSGLDVLRGDGGFDYLDGGEGDDRLEGGADDDTLAGGLGNDTILGGDGADLIADRAMGTFDAVGLDQVFGGEGDDTIQVAGNISGGGGDDRIQFGYQGSEVSEITVTGGAGDDSLRGVFGLATGITAIVDGGEGDDTLTGTLSTDRLIGGPGDDRIWPVSGDDTVEAGAGDDLVIASLGSNLIFGQAGNDTVFAGSFGGDTIDGGADNDSLVGSAASDSMLGGTGDDTLPGFEGDDTLEGGGGADSLVGDAGADSLLGGAGNDTLSGGDDADILDGGENDDALDGGDGDDTLAGGLGNDTLDDIEGVNTAVFRGVSTDYLIDTTSNPGFITVTDNNAADGDEGVDLLRGFRSARFSNTTVALDPDAPLNITGTNGPDTLRGGGGDDTINGLGGNDDLDGGNGDDSIDGGADNDTLTGGFGNDTLAGGDGDDRIIGSWRERDIGSAELNEVSGGEGDDTISAPGNISGDGGNDVLRYGYQGSAVTEIMVFGGVGDDSLVSGLGHVAGVTAIVDGGDGDDTIGGTSFADSIIGGLGDDSINPSFGNDTVEAGEGDDVVIGSRGNNLILGQAGNDTLFAFGVGEETLDGGAGNDSLVGRFHDDSLLGGSGEDTLQGFMGNDILTGGDGTDTAIYEGPRNSYTIAGDGSSIVVVDNGDGIDTEEILLEGRDVLTGIEILQLSDDPSFALSAAVAGTVEKADAGGGSITGTAFDDELTGNGGNDTLVGFAGNDRLIGLLGLDVLRGDGGNDFIDGGEGEDSLDGGADNDTLTGGLGNDTLLGGDGADVIIGSTEPTIGAGDLNQVFGGDGDDTIVSEGNISGGGGNDQITAGYQGTETKEIILSGGPGNDTIAGTRGVTDGVMVMLDGGDGDDNIRGLSSGARNATNRITGGSGNDTILSGTGNDTVEAGEGDDVVSSNAGNDLILGQGGDDTLIGAIFSIRGRTTLDGGAGNDVLEGRSSDESLRGGTGDDTLQGFGGNDTLDGGISTGSLLGDIAIYRGPREFYTVIGSQSELFVVDNRPDSPDGADLLTDIETLRFSDGEVAVSDGFGESEINGTPDNDNGQPGQRPALVGTPIGDTINGLSGDDLLQGFAGFDVLSGGAGEDTLVGGVGNDTINGGDTLSNDTAVFSGDRSDYLIDVGSTIVVTDQNVADGNDGVDRLINVRFLDFATGDDFFVNEAPVSIDDTAETKQGVAVDIPVAELLVNDSDTDGDQLSITEVTSGTGGVAQFFGGASPFVRFTPEDGFNGTAAFSYRVSDGNGGSDMAMVSVQVTGPPVLSIAPFNAQQPEGDGSNTVFAFEVTRTGDLDEASSVDYAVQPFETDVDDFSGGAFPSSTVNLAAGETSQFIAIDIEGDMDIENDEQFLVALSNPVNGTIDPFADSASGTIENDDFPDVPFLDIFPISPSQDEGDTGETPFLFQAVKRGDPDDVVSADISVSGGDVDPADFGGALPVQRIEFGAGELVKDFVVNVSGDTDIEPDEAFDVTLTNIQGGQPGITSVSGVIGNDDLRSPTPDKQICIEFDQLFDGTEIGAGTRIDGSVQLEGVTLEAIRRQDKNGRFDDGMIFDTANPTGGDTDLASTDQGNVLIISEDGDSSDPDDNAQGGIIRAQFDRPSTANSVTVFDTDGSGNRIDLFDSNGSLLASFAIPPVADGEKQVVDLGDTENVSTLEVVLISSGAIDDLKFTPDSSGLPPAITSPDMVHVDENETFVLDLLTQDDKDIEPDGLMYSVFGGNDGDAFSIDPGVGALSFKEAPDFENPTDQDGDNVYEVNVRVTDSDGLTDTQAISVKVGDVDEATGPPLKVGIFDTDTDELITLLEDGDDVPLSLIKGRHVTVAATVPDDSPLFGRVESAFVDLNDGDATSGENFEPYASAGDFDGDFQGSVDLPIGTNSIVFELFSEDDRQGSLVDIVTIDFTVVDDLPSQPPVEIGLYDADTNALISLIEDGDTFKFSDADRRDLTIGVLVPDDSDLAGYVESVFFNLNNGQETKTENIEPYTLYGNRKNDFFDQDGLPTGENTLELEFYSRDQRKDDLIETISIDFTIENDDLLLT